MKIMIIGVGWEQLPLVKAADKMNLEIIICSTWKKISHGYGKVYDVDSRNLAELEHIFLLEKPDAVISDECDYSMYAVSYLCQKYNLPGPGLKPLTITNNKYLQRSMLNGVAPQPDFRLVWDLDETISEASSLGYPVVIKPVDNRGSIGISRVNNENEIKAAFYKAIENSHSRMCIVEKFVSGETVTLEAFCDTHKYHGLVISTKENYPSCENVAKVVSYPGNLDIRLKKRLFDLAERIAGELDLHYGFCHFEFIINRETGEIWFVEVANRGGGVHISNIILKELFSFDFSKALIDLSFGVDVKFIPQKTNSAVLLYFLSPTGGVSFNELIKTDDDILFSYLKKQTDNYSVKEAGALGRKGAIIRRGSSFEEIYEKCLEFEAMLALENDEVLWYAE